jgi:hypothetical protein
LCCFPDHFRACRVPIGTYNVIGIYRRSIDLSTRTGLGCEPADASRLGLSRHAGAVAFEGKVFDGQDAVRSGGMPASKANR